MESNMAIGLFGLNTRMSAFSSRGVVSIGEFGGPGDSGGEAIIVDEAVVAVVVEWRLP
jgi:hypothetical protein